MSQEKDNDRIDLSKLFGTVLDYKWFIILCTLLFAGLGVGYALLATPIYTANALIQVEAKNSGGIFQEFSTISEQDASANTEIAIVKSRMILEKAVKELNLDTRISPIFSTPIIGKGLSRLSGESSELAIPHFEPMEGFETVILEIGPTAQQYRLFDKEGDQLLLEGNINQKYENDSFSIQVSILKGNIGQRFSVEKISELDAIERLQRELSVIERGKQTGVIEVSLNGENQRLIKRIVKSVTENYILQDIARNSEEASKSLVFLENRLPEVREKLAESENNLNEYRQKHGSVDLGLEAKSFLDTLVQLEADLNELTIRESDISQKYTKNHPTYVSLLEQRNVLLSERDRLTKQLESLPDTQKEVIRLTRDLEVEQQIYVQLLNKAQELNVVKAGVVGNVRILDVAQVLPNPVAPKKVFVVIFATMLGFMLSVSVAVVRMLFNRGIESTAEADKIGLPTYATIPYSTNQDKITLNILTFKKGGQSKLQLLSESSPTDVSIEALRSLRTSLHFAMLEAKNNIVMLSGTSPGVGKSFIASNFANIVAKAGQKVLLIDADLRRSYMGAILGVERGIGLSEVLSKDIPFEDVVQKVPNCDFDVILKGGAPSNPSELLSTNRFEKLLEWASKKYDLVLIDTPPVLAVTDPAIIGRYVGTTFLIGFFEKTTVKELEKARNVFARAGVTVNGFILNGVKRKASNSEDYYQYEYK
ncbi:polysaccharide biosynthesis tyrosine autokinase [Glaesserella sp.]|uniref:polysaccharide biosynthesis tyrosine autokinase n=1 Tax=Glaesserella sp. TaxID=2094731 RepID=UPI0035A1C411